MKSYNHNNLKAAKFTGKQHQTAKVAE